MKNNFYNTWRERHNLPTMDEKLAIAGICVETGRPSVFELEHQLEDALNDRVKSNALLATIYDKNPEVYRNRLEAAIRKANEGKDGLYSKNAELAADPVELDGEIDPLSEITGVQ